MKIKSVETLTNRCVGFTRLTTEDCHAIITDAPGWGVEIDPKWLENSAYQISEVR